MALINTIHGPLEDSTLIKRTGVFDNDNETTGWVEYCLSDCAGRAHQTNTPDAMYHFCSRHIHRSVHVALKQGVEALGVAADFGQ